MPSRYLRPEIRTSRRWSACSWCAQSFYIRLITLVDDYGRYEADPVILCSEAFPTFRHFRPGKVQKLLAELHANDLIRLYQHGGKTYLQVTRWKERVRSTQSKFPAPPGLQIEQAAVVNACNQGTSQTALRTDAATTSDPRPPSPSPQPTPTPDSPHDVEPPQNFPKGEDEAVSQAIAVGAPAPFIKTIWNKAMSRAGRDSKDIPIRSWPRYVASEWAYEKERKSRNATYPKPGQQRVNRNIGTANEGIAHLYANLGTVIKG